MTPEKLFENEQERISTYFNCRVYRISFFLNCLFKTCFVFPFENHGTHSFSCSIQLEETKCPKLLRKMIATNYCRQFSQYLNNNNNENIQIYFKSNLFSNRTRILYKYYTPPLILNVSDNYFSSV